MQSSSLRICNHARGCSSVSTLRSRGFAGRRCAGRRCAGRRCAGRRCAGRQRREFRISDTPPWHGSLGRLLSHSANTSGRPGGESWPSAGRCQCQCVRSGAVDRHWRVCNLAAGRGGAAQLDGQRAPKLLSSFVFRRHWRVMNG